MITILESTFEFGISCFNKTGQKIKRTFGEELLRRDAFNVGRFGRLICAESHRIRLPSRLPERVDLLKHLNDSFEVNLFEQLI